MSRLLFIFLLLPILSFAQSPDGTFKTITATMPTADNYIISEALPATYDSREKFIIVLPSANTTTTPTLNRNGLGVKLIKNQDGTSPSIGAISGRILLSYNGTFFQIVGGSSGASFTPANLSTSTTGVSIVGGSNAVNGSGTTISIQNASISQTGLLTNTDWNTFNNKGSGSVTSVASADASITVTNPTSAVDLSVIKAPKWTTARNLAGNSVDGTINVPFSNKFIVQGTTDAGLSNAQFIGSLSTGIVKNTTTTGVLSIATSGTDYELPLTFSSPLSRTTNTISIPIATSSVNGYLSSTDWSTFNGKQSAGNYITALTGDITANGPASVAATLATVNANVGTFGSSTQVAQTTYNAKGLATAVSNVTITPAASSITGGTALTKTDDTNVTLTLGGTPASALLAATSITAGWTGTLAYSRLSNGGGLSIIGRSTNSAGVQADITGTTDQVLRVNSAGTVLGFGSIDLSKSGTIGASILAIANGGTGTSSFTTGSIPYFDGTKLNQDNNNLEWNSASHLLNVGTGGDFSGTDMLNIYNQGDAYLPQSAIGALTTSGATPGWTSSSSAGTGASPSNISTGNLVGGFSMWGYTNSNYTPVGGAWSFMSGSTSSNLGGEYRIYTKADGGSLTQRFTIDNAGGIQSVSTTPTNTLTNTFTASANNQYGLTGNVTSTSRTNTNDVFGGHNFVSYTLANGTNIDNTGFTIDTTPTVQGAVSTLNGSPGGSATANFETKTTAGMTVTTFNNITANSTNSVNGTGVTFDVVVATATNFTSIVVHPGSAGTLFRLGETFTFLGSQFGGSGTCTIGISAVTNTMSATSGSLRIINRLPDTKGITRRFTDFESGTLNYGSIDGIKSASGTQQIAFNDGSGQLFNSDGTTLTVNRNLLMGGVTTLTANALTMTGAFSTGSTITSTGANLNSQAFLHSGSLRANAANAMGSYNTTSTNIAGLIRDYGAGAGGTIAGGSSYTNGTYTNVPLTGGSPTTAAQATITVAGGVVTNVTFTVGNRGVGYTSGNVLSASAANIGGTGSGFTYTLNATDFNAPLAGYISNNTFTDAVGSNSHWEVEGTSTIIQSGAATGDIGGFLWNPTLTSTTGTIKGVVIVPTTSKSCFGCSTPTATLHVVGTTKLDGNVTLPTAGDKLFITEGSNGSVGQTTLVSGTKAITITGTTTSSRCFYALVTASGVTLTTAYQCVCTANTVTLQANVAAGTINTADGSTLNYWIVN